jgi:hypothetical protein
VVSVFEVESFKKAVLELDCQNVAVGVQLVDDVDSKSIVTSILSTSRQTEMEFPPFEDAILLLLLLNIRISPLMMMPPDYKL